MRLFDLLSRGKQCGSISNHGHVASARVDVAKGRLLPQVIIRTGCGTCRRYNILRFAVSGQALCRGFHSV